MDNEIENIYVMATEFGLLDPITQLPARDENSISALLCIYHQQGKIDWAQVPLLDLNRLCCTNHVRPLILLINSQNH